MDDDTPERWLPVPGWDGLYEVSDLGRVRSLPRHTVSGVRGGRVLKSVFAGAGYRAVILSDGRKRRTTLIHQLVLSAFAGPRPFGMQVRHGPGGRTDNRLVNLCWGTRAENAADKTRDGTDQVGTRNHQAKLTEDDVRQIRMRYVRGGIRLVDLGAEFGVTKSNISCVIRRETWRHVL